MAKQSGIIKLKGTVGGISFYKSKDGYLAREKGGVDGERIKKDPAFKRTRENGAEFGRAGSAGKVLRNAFQEQIMCAADKRIVSRLTKEMVKVIHADATSQRGERNVLDGELELLTGFEFNIGKSVKSVNKADYSSLINRATGLGTLALNDFVPKTHLLGPEGATHVQIVSALAEIDFEANTTKVVTSTSVQIEVDSVEVAEVELSNEIGAGSTKPIFLVYGVVFSQLVNGTYNAMSASSNALVLAAVSGLAD